MSTPAEATSPPRDAAIDAARVVATVLVVLHHTAITYGATGGWFYKEVAPGTSLQSMALLFFCTLNQAWFMGFFFLLAGYFTPAALQAQGGARYLWARFLRLGVPLLVFGFVLGPFTIALARTATGALLGDTLLGLWSRGVFEKGPLWFAWALLLMALATVALRAWLGRPLPRPSNTQMAAAAVVTGLVAFALRLGWPVGVEVWGLQLGYFASYVVLYGVGLLAAPGRWLESWPAAQVWLWRRVAWVSLPVLPLVALLGPKLFGLPGRAEGGFSVPALVYALWEPLVAWGVILGLLHHLQQRAATLGPLWPVLAQRAFAVFVIHPPVVVAVALAWRDVPAPPLLKFAVTGAVALLLCFLLAGLLLRVPGVRRFL